MGPKRRRVLPADTTLEGLVETGEYIAGNVTVAETKKQYRRQFGHVKQFLELRFPDSYREGEMIFLFS
jgi:hypothetical protein